jgi:hypothetical protein
MSRLFQKINVDEITVSRNFKKLLKSDWVSQFYFESSRFATFQTLTFKTNAVIVGILNAEGHIIQGPRRHKKHYDTSIHFAQRRRVPCTLW